MNSSDDIEKRLRGTPLPSYTNRLHRDTLKQALLAEIEKENRMAEKITGANGTAMPATAEPRRRLLRSRWILAAASVVAVACATLVGVLKFSPRAESVAAMKLATDVSTKTNVWFESMDRSANISQSGGTAVEKSLDSKGDWLSYAFAAKAAGIDFPSPSTRGSEGRINLSELLSAYGPSHPTVKKFPPAEGLAVIGGDKARPIPFAIGEPPTSDNYAPIIDNPFHKPAQTPLSTFSIDVDTASYTNVRRFLIRENRLPPKDAIRIEEMVNFFDYSDPAPKDGKPVAINAEVGPCPWNAQHRLVRVGLRATAIDPEQAPARNLVFLVDTSGSMQSPDRLPLLKKGLAMLVETLRPMDRVAIVAYAGSAGLVLPSLPGTEKKQILDAIDRLESGGSTNGGQGIELAYGIAMANIIPKGVNRVILGTDGDFNVGVTSQGELVRLIEEKRKSGVFLSVLGFGHGNLKDGTMEQLAHHGNGHYAYIDTIEEARRLFVEQGAALQVVAGDVKVQVEFNPARVAAYRLVGYENRLMKDQDFNDDKKDAGDMGSGHSVTAIYEVVPACGKVEVPAVDPLRYQEPAKLAAAANNGELMVVKVRYKEPGEEKSKLIERPVTDDDRVLAKTSDDFRFAAAVTEFALLLRDSPNKGTATYDDVLRLARGAFGRDLHGHRAAFVQLVQTAQRLSRVE